jgi:hypothetical protein
MSNSDQPETGVDKTAVDKGVGSAKKSGCVALVPVIPLEQWSRNHRRWSPNSTFVTHLIATAEHVPQTCGLRRASLADARTAYNATRSPVRDPGGRTRQII